jgi:predicted DNA binding CopG/RHH family protein
MRTHYCSLRVEEDTRKRIKELAAKAGMPMKDFVKEAFDIKEGFENEKKKVRFDFRL